MCFNDLRAIFRGVLPFARVRLLHQRDALHAVPFRFADPVCRVRREREVVRVLAVELPSLRLPASGVVVTEGASFHGLSLKLAMSKRARNSAGITSSGFCKTPVASSTYWCGIPIARVEGAEVPVELLTEVLLRVPAELADR